MREVKRRFPGIHVYNGYGPTESTDLVTLCEITDEMLENDLALPIGYAKTGSDLVVLEESRESCLSRVTPLREATTEGLISLRPPLECVRNRLLRDAARIARVTR